VEPYGLLKPLRCVVGFLCVFLLNLVIVFLLSSWHLSVFSSCCAKGPPNYFNNNYKNAIKIGNMCGVLGFPFSALELVFTQETKLL
jgi:hypothetical protein